MSALSPRLLFLLDEACKPIREAFHLDADDRDGLTELYLVGTANERGAYRDVDVRLMLGDPDFDRLYEATGPRTMAFLGLAIGEYLAARTGLPIDFQIQRTSWANFLHSGGRSRLGKRRLLNYAGDAQEGDALAAQAVLAAQEVRDESPAAVPTTSSGAPGGFPTPTNPAADAAPTDPEV